ncbi:energy transducer TonB family protein [Dyadobacter diqingensis]|uniref:energy transducer TonB family protein n=1 Tax=Dyadobacter diqingensis TaxID=2938121 RepID=UPI0020C196C9|nr:energy transducer TonB [Dyadobacter diqingensis]
MNRITFILLLSLLSIHQCYVASAITTVDKLIFQGKEIRLLANPLDDLPQDSSRIRIDREKKECLKQDCWKGYQAEWTIIDNQLYLTAIYGCCFTETGKKSDLEYIFGDKVINGRVKADWVTGLYFAEDKYLFSVYDYTVYKTEFKFQFRTGRLTDVETYDNSRSRSSIYCGDSRKLFEYIYSNIRWHALPDVNTDSSRVFVSFSANEEGLIDSVQVLRGRNSIFNQEVIRVIKSIPGWCVLYQKGQFKRIHYNYPIAFNRELFERYKK